MDNPSTTSVKEDLFGEQVTDSATWSKWQVNVKPQLHFPLKDKSKTIVIDQNYKGFGELGSRVWDGGLVLSRFLERLGNSYFNGRKCIELGSGTGLSGIVAASVGANIILTDKESLLPLLRHNIKQNQPSDSSTTYQVEAQELFWGNQNPFSHSFDVVIGADLTYDFEDLPILISTMETLTSKESIIYLAYGAERAAMSTFFDLVSPNFVVQKIWKEDELDSSDIEKPSFHHPHCRIEKKVNGNKICCAYNVSVSNKLSRSPFLKN